MADLTNYVSGGAVKVKLHEVRDRVHKANDGELKSILDQCSRELIFLRSQGVTQTVSNPMRIRQVRKLIARVKTEQSARHHLNTNAPHSYLRPPVKPKYRRLRTKKEQSRLSQVASKLHLDAKSQSNVKSQSPSQQIMMPTTEAIAENFRQQLNHRREIIASLSTQRLEAMAAKVEGDLNAEKSKNTGENVRSLVEDLAKFND